MNERKHKRRLRPIFSLLIICLVIALGCTIGIGIKSLLNHKNDKVVIVIDAGHDASNPGFEGYITEYEYTSKLANKLEEKLKDNKNFEVILTHKEDEDKTIGKRVEAANNADLILSIHASSDSNPSVSGKHIVSKPSNLKGSTQSKKVAKAVSSKLENSILCYEYYEPLTDNTYSIKYVDIADETKYDYETCELMEQTDIPVVQIEGLYVTNSDDVTNNTSEEMLDNVASSIVSALEEVYE